MARRFCLSACADRMIESSRETLRERFSRCAHKPWRWSHPLGLTNNLSKLFPMPVPPNGIWGTPAGSSIALYLSPLSQDTELICISNSYSTQRIGRITWLFPDCSGYGRTGSADVDVGDVPTEDRERSDFVRRSGLLAYESPGETGGLGFMCAGGSVAEVFSAFGEQIA